MIKNKIIFTQNDHIRMADLVFAISDEDAIGSFSDRAFAVLRMSISNEDKVTRLEQILRGVRGQ